MMPNLPVNMVLCERHRDQAADQYCKRHRALICFRCAFEEHADHRNEFVEVKSDILEQYITHKVSALEAKKEAIVKVLEHLQLI